MDIIFETVAAILYAIGGITGLTYNEVNIALYYGVIPFSWLAMLDRYFRFHWLKIGFAALWILFLLLCPSFSAFSDGLFDGSVVFLKWFSRLGMNYIVASVVICVILPLMIYALPGYMLIRKRPFYTADKNQTAVRNKLHYFASNLKTKVI